MEQTFGRSARADEDPFRNRTAGPSRSRTLDVLLRAWSDRGQAPPVAIVVSIFDDLLEHAVLDDAHDRELALDDVLIEPSGFARLAAASLSVSAASLAPLLARALGAGLEEELMPPAARALLGRLASDDHVDRAVDSEQLRRWIREALGTPATRDEVSAWVKAAASAVSLGDSDAVIEDVVIESAIEQEAIAEPEPIDEPEPIGAGASEPPLITVPPGEFVEVTPVPPDAAPESPESAAELAEAARPEPSEAPTEPPHPADPLLAAELAEAATVQVSPSSPSAPVAAPPVATASEPSGDLPGARPVVRHEWRPANVTMPAAPAARRSARPSLDTRDMLAIPGERNPWQTWLIAVVVAIAIGFLWFRC